MKTGKKLLQLAVNFIIRAIVGAGLIFLINSCFAEPESSWRVGQNALTFLTSGLLGIPGVCLLYGIQFL